MKKIVSIFLSIIITLAFAVNCYALQPSNDVNPSSGSSEFPFRFWTIDMLRKVGLIYDPNRPISLQEYANKINQVDGEANVQADETSISNWCQNNSTVTQDSNNNYNVTLNSNYRTFLTNLGNSLIDGSGYYYKYSSDVNNSLTLMPSGEVYTAIRQFLVNNDYYLCLYGILLSGNGYDTYSFACTRDRNIGFVVEGYFSNRTRVNMYYLDTWESVQLNNDDFDIYVYSNGEFIELDANDIESMGTSRTSIAMFNNPDDTFIGLGYMYGVYSSVSINGVDVYVVYKTLNDLKNGSVGASAYYTSSNWQDFSTNNSGNYTVDSSNSNNITYGDTIQYINNYYDNNNDTYPDPTQIQIFIDNNVPVPTPTPTPTPNPDDPNGGDDPTFDLGFLGTIGRLIGSLITGIGNLITGILEGIVNALTGILSFLTTLINDVANVIPQGITDLFGTILGWLPDEWMTVISLGILSMVLIGIFRIFK